MKKLLLLAVIIVWVSISIAQTGDFLKVKQNFSGDYSLLYLHNSKNVVWQCIYDSRQSFVVGVGPAISFKCSNVCISTSIYANAILNLKDQDFPLSAYMGELFMVPSMDNWTLFTRTVLTVNSNELKQYFSGRYFLSYKLGSYNPRILSEIKETDERVIVFLGPSVEYKINNYSISFYVGTDLKTPNQKMGWLEIKFKI